MRFRIATIPTRPSFRNLLRKDWGRLFVVHRIDKDTTGILLFARSPEAHKTLGEAFATGAVTKVYHALVRGLPAGTRPDASCRSRPTAIAHTGRSSTRTRARLGHGLQSHRPFRLCGDFPGAALVEARPETGRTHQIRVHLASLGFPCLCDPLYGDGKPLLLSAFKRRWRGDLFEERPLVARAALHACRPSSRAPSGELMRFEAPLPKDLRAAISQLGKR